MASILGTIRQAMASKRLPRWCMYGGLFLLIWGAKLWLIHLYGNATPNWDEWAGEGKVLTASVERTLTPALFFEPNNEHRIVFTRLLCLLLFRADKQWDAILFMVAQAPFHALAVVVFVALAGRSMSGMGRAALAGFAGGITILPFGWKNTLWGFQSQFYFMTLLGILVIWFCWNHRSLSPRWWLGALLAFASLFTMAGGVFAIVAVTVFLAARLVTDRGKDWRAQLIGIGVLLAITAFGILITPRNIDNAFRAPNFHAFFWALTGVLSWPCRYHWAFIVIQAPLVITSFLLLFRRVPFSNGCWFVIINGAAFWIDAIVTAYQRYGLWEACKYCDTWSLLLIAGCSCFYFLWTTIGARHGHWICLLAAVWLSACLYGALDRAVNLVPGQLADFHAGQMETENHTRQYLATGNPAWLKSDIPCPDPVFFKQMLDSPAVRAILPPNLIDPAPPLSPAEKKFFGNEFIQSGFPDSMPPLGKAAYGSLLKSGTAAKVGISLLFHFPRGMTQMDLQVAGYPNAKGMTFKMEQGRTSVENLAPALDPGEHWQTILVPLSPKCASLRISAKDQSGGKAWFAFSMPVVSKGHAPGLWARSMAGASLYFIDAGLVLLLLGAAGGIRELPRDKAGIPEG